MSKHQTPPLSGAILDEATSWFVELNEGEVGETSRERFVQWLRSSPEHVRAYLQVTAHWEDARVFKKSVPTIDELVSIGRKASSNVVALETGMSERLHDNDVEAPARPGRIRRWLIAASIVMAGVGAGTLYWIQNVTGVYTTQAGEERSISLEDGSSVVLNARSKIRVNYHTHERNIELIAGQALFRVSKDHARPFVVETGATRVVAVGTQFDVYKRPSGITVTVVEGTVAILPSSASLASLSAAQSVGREIGALQTNVRQSLNRMSAGRADANSTTIGEEVAPVHTDVLLAAGEQATVSKDLLKRDDHPDVAAATAWTEQKIVLNATPLSKVAEEFNRYNARPLVITDPNIANIRVSGVFSSTSPDSLLKGLEVMNQFRVRVLPDRIEISAR